MADARMPLDGAQTAALLFDCIDYISDILLVTEAEPLGLPGPRVVFVNQAFERITGYAAAEIVGRTPRLLQGPNTNRAELERIRTELEKGKPLRAELVNYKKSGEEFIVEMDVVPLGDDHGRPTHWVSIQRDVTARKKAEAEAVARETLRYESLSTLSSGIAHDFNNIIAAILGNVANGSVDMQAGRMPQASMDQIQKAALRARSVVANILAYARRRSDVMAALQLAPVVQEATDLLRAILPADVRLTLNYPTAPLWVRGDTTQLCQVLLNLGINALQSLAEGERGIVFTLSSTSESAGAAAPTRYATIEVTDTGGGMNAATKARIFEPYFTTKGDGQGTGLGLSVVWGVVKAHGGSIAVDSEVGRGSRFQVSLPLIAEFAEESLPPPEPTRMAVIGKGEHVLVVDDDEVVVLMLEGMLERWGFRVTTLQDPLKAVSLLKNAPEQFDVVVTDLNMPNVSGLQLAREALAVRRDLPIILGSGTVTDELVEAASEAGIAAVFPKEFAVERLGALLVTSLARVARPNPPPGDDNPPGAAPEDERMHRFLTSHRVELIERCVSMVARRPRRLATPEQLANGVPLFLGQLVRALSAVGAGQTISGHASGESESAAGATAHGKQLRDLGYSVDQVVHDYGDLCQAITDVAAERDAPFSVAAYRTLNRCLDHAVADAVTAFAAQRDADFEAVRSSQESQRLSFLAHELRNYLHSALLAFDALESGKLSVAGSTGAMLKRNLHGLDELIDQTIAEVGPAAPPSAA